MSYSYDHLYSAHPTYSPTLKKVVPHLSTPLPTVATTMLFVLNHWLLLDLSLQCPSSAGRHVAFGNIHSLDRHVRIERLFTSEHPVSQIQTTHRCHIVRSLGKTLKLHLRRSSIVIVETLSNLNCTYPICGFSEPAVAVVCVPLSYRLLHHCISPGRRGVPSSIIVAVVT